MITKSDIKKLSALARIEIPGEEEEGLARELGSVLSYFQKLKEVSRGSDQVKLESAENSGSSLREDREPIETWESAATLVNAASKTEKGFIKVKAVFDRAKLDF